MMLSSLILLFMFVGSTKALDFSNCNTIEESGECPNDTCTSSLVYFIDCYKATFYDDVHELQLNVTEISENESNTSTRVLILWNKVNNFSLTCEEDIYVLNGQINCISNEVAILLDDICDVEEVLDECKDRLVNLTDIIYHIQYIIDNSHCPCNKTAAEEILTMWEGILLTPEVHMLKYRIDQADGELEALEHYLNHSSAELIATDCNETITNITEIEYHLLIKNYVAQDLAYIEIPDLLHNCSYLLNWTWILLNEKRNIYEGLDLTVDCTSDGIGPCCDDLVSVESYIGETTEGVQNITEKCAIIEAEYQALVDLAAMFESLGELSNGLLGLITQ